MMMRPLRYADEHAPASGTARRAAGPIPSHVYEVLVEMVEREGEQKVVFDVPGDQEVLLGVQVAVLPQLAPELLVAEQLDRPLRRALGRMHQKTGDPSSTCRLMPPTAPRSRVSASTSPRSPSGRNPP